MKYYNQQRYDYEIHEVDLTLLIALLLDALKSLDRNIFWYHQSKIEDDVFTAHTLSKKEPTFCARYVLLSFIDSDD